MKIHNWHQSLSTLKERRAYTASRINRSTGITDAGQMYKYQRETYGKSGKITGALLGIGSAQYHQYKHKCKHNLGQQAPVTETPSWQALAPVPLTPELEVSTQRTAEPKIAPIT